MDEKIDINRADAEMLALLPGIGLKRAEKIVEYRTAVHPFEEVIELTAVPGISERMVRAIADQIMVNGGAAEMAETADLVEIDSPVEVVAVDGHGVEPVAEQPEGEDEAGEETAELEVEPLMESPTSDIEEEEPPVVVTMLDSGPGQPETAALPEAESAPETAVRRPPPAPEVIERRVVETVQRRHFHFWQQFLGVMAGALIGSLLTLVLLYFLNGTLRFAGEGRAADLQLQLDEETSAIRQAQGSMTDEMGDLTGRVAELDNELTTSQEAIGVVEEDVSGLEDETAALNERLEAIDLAAEKFDNFLIGLRDLLVAIQGLPPLPTATMTISGTATISATISGTVTPEGTAVAPTPTPTATGPTPIGGVPTRTPRPTATNIIETQN